jgi:hypothetical protein
MEIPNSKLFKNPCLSFTTIELLAIYNDSHCPAELVSASDGGGYNTFQSVTLCMFSTFVLKQRVEPEIQGKWEPLRAFCRPCTATPNFFLYHSFTSYYIAYVFTSTTFSKTHSGAILKCDEFKALYPAFLCLQHNHSLNSCGIRRCTTPNF